MILDGHDPFPAVVVDAAWEMVAANRSVGLLTEGVAPFFPADKRTADALWGASLDPGPRDA